MTQYPFYRPIQVFEISPHPWNTHFKIRTSLGWIILGTFCIKTMLTSHQSFIEDAQVEAGGALLHFRYEFNAQQINQLQEYLTE